MAQATDHVEREEQEPDVDLPSELRETASDYEQPLELLREALSNSFDADAQSVSIEMALGSNEFRADLTITDDGCGMDRQDLASFFDLANSRKRDTETAIGYKGHGTKLYYRSDRIAVTTTDAETGETRRAVMEDPWDKLQEGDLPTYSIYRVQAPEHEGTTIKLTDTRFTGLSVPRLTYARLEHYLRWQTIAGSVANRFGEENPMAVHVELDDEIDDGQPLALQEHYFPFPDEHREPGSDPNPAEPMCRHYKPYTLPVEYTDETGTDRETTVEVCGFIAGEEARQTGTPTWHHETTDFGVWLATDSILVEQITDDCQIDIPQTSMMIIANCDDLDLTANRSSIRDRDSPLVTSVIEAVDRHLMKIQCHSWVQDEFLPALEASRHQSDARRTSDELSDRRDRLAEEETPTPSTLAELMLRYEQLLDDVSVRDLRPESDAVALVDVAGTEGLAAVAAEQSLADILAEEIAPVTPNPSAPLDTVDRLVVWEMGDRDAISEIERRGWHDWSVDVEQNAPNRATLTLSKPSQSLTLPIRLLSAV